MNLGLRRGPNVSEAGARPSTFPPSRQAMDALREPRTSEERKAREERNRQWAEQEVAARAAEKQRTEAQQRNYNLLEDLNTRPRTSYMAVVQNPNPDLEQSEQIGRESCSERA